MSLTGNEMKLSRVNLSIGLMSILCTSFLTADEDETVFDSSFELMSEESLDNFSSDFVEEELAVVQEDLPRYPEPPSDYEEDQILHTQIKGLVLVTERDNLLCEPELGEVEGLYVIDLSIPGGVEKLACKIDPLYYNQPLTRRSLQELKFAISSYYREMCFPLVIVEVPEQDITSGVLQLVVTQGILGNICVEGNEYFSGRRLAGYVRLEQYQPINENCLVRDLNFINRNPFRRVDAVYSPGQEVGTTDITLMVDDRRPLRFYAGVENTGIPTISRQRWLAGFNWGNAFWLDHILAYQFTSAYNPGEFFAHTLQYIAPLSWHHILNLYGGYSRVHADLPIPNTRNVGRSYQASGRYTIPIWPSRYLYHELILGFDWKRTNNSIEFSDQILNVGDNVNLSQFVFGYGGNYERRRYRLDFGTELFWSPGKIMSDESNSNYESLRPGAKNNWVYVTGQLAYLQNIGCDFSLFLEGKGQWTYRNLIASEQFYFGGYDTVRGYNQRQVNTDNGLILSGELRSPAVRVLKNINPCYKMHDAFQFLIFLDYGWGIDHDAIPTIPKAQWLMGVGPGLRYTIEPYLTARLDWGVKLHKKSIYGGGNTMVHFSVVASY